MLISPGYQTLDSSFEVQIQLRRVLHGTPAPIPSSAAVYAPPATTPSNLLVKPRGSHEAKHNGPRG